MNKRIFLETHDGSECIQIERRLSRHLGRAIDGVRKITVFELLDTNEESYEKMFNVILYNPLVHSLSETIELGENYIAYEALDGQYDQISEWSTTLLGNETEVKVSWILIFEEKIDLDKVKRLLVNPLEYKEKDMSTYYSKQKDEMKKMNEYPNFISYTEDELTKFYNESSFAMELEDLFYIQDYFKSEGRNPSETELLVLDTYWSDHCRHTTFMSELTKVEFDEFELSKAIKDSFEEYLADKKELGREDKPLSLMDITAQNARYARNVLNDTTIEVSEEVNACSIKINVDVDGVEEPWLLMFKNETHNHPTEIEPFGGASTCIGGAIRDPLSGRSYVYQAMRITGCGNVLETLDETRRNKLPQEFIATSAADGYSHYAKQIGISSSYVKEIYHNSYTAKRMELGAVVGAVAERNLIRETPVDGDVIIMLGGRTGRDGVGGATGSSDAQTSDAMKVNAAEVQKGNALEERKIVRLFRNPEVTKMIKKSNDFGAGGVAVAIGELAPGIEVDLSKVKLKYPSLNPTEITISESQERMAVVVEQANAKRLIELAAMENCEAVVVAKVNDSNRLVIKDEDATYVDLDRTFLDSGGITQKREVLIACPNQTNPFIQTYEINESNILKEIGLLKNASQAGLAQYFDASDALIKPLLGKNNLSPNIGSVQKIPLLEGTTTTVSLLTHGFIPAVNEYSPYIGGSLAVVESLSKTVAMGGDYSKVYLSFQEYFNRLTTPQKWGNVMQALLGTYSAQKALNICAIGGKDSMSGSFEEIDVVDTLVSFACSPQKEEHMISSELKRIGSNIYIIETPMDNRGLVDYKQLTNNYSKYHELVKQGLILSASTSDDASIIVALTKMAFGNEIAYDITIDEQLTAIKPGTIIFETEEELSEFTYIGKTVNSEVLTINGVEISFEEAIRSSTEVLEPIYPSGGFSEVQPKEVLNSMSTTVYKDDVAKVLIPVFPGTTGEYELGQEFINQGAKVEYFVYRNNPEEFVSAIEQSNIIALAQGSANGDVPQVASVITQCFWQDSIKDALEKHLSKGKLILGFGNGYQALVLSGLLPNEKVTKPNISISKNDTGRHVSLEIEVEPSGLDCLWTKGIDGKQRLYSSNTYGRLVGKTEMLHPAFYYSGINPSGSIDGIESLVSNYGHVFGRMSKMTSDIIKNAIRGIVHE